MTICTIIRDPKTKEVSKVLAPNGEESILYNSILDSFEQKDKEESLKAWAFAYTDTFKNIFGDWEVNDEKTIGKLDSNGEPLFEDYSNVVDEYVLNNPGKDTETSFDELLNDKETFGETIEIEPAEIKTPATSDARDPNVAYMFKGVGLITDNISKIRSWERNKSISPELLFNKIIQLGVPKNQLVLIMEQPGETVEEKLASFAGTYSYAIEINITKGKAITQGPNDAMSLEEGEFFRLSDLYLEQGLSQIEADKKAREELKSKKDYNTQYYSNLTVPGGVNYTENEIATPDITPTIKGHAQFSTDKGIGWFRSDDKDSEQKKEFSDLLNKNRIEDTNKLNELRKTKDLPTKTRRILEVQSDLFQKGRQKEELSKVPVSSGLIYKLKNIGADNGQKFNVKGVWFEVIDKKLRGDRMVYQVRNMNDNTKTSWMTNDAIVKAVEDYYKTNTSSNAFLQLLNKDNNWVTFFTKSIIQDSAKKGYEKVLFPSGDTASKVEGHTTLEQFKKEKEDRIKELEKQQNKLDSDLDQGLYGMDTSDYDLRSDKISQEIDALEKELERVEGPEGFGALRPIYNFYENTITNVLRKQGFSPKQVTDEYGNTWNEIELKSTMASESIMLQTEDTAASEPSDKTLNNRVTAFLESIGVSIQSVDVIRDANGNKLSANAKADMLNRIIEVVQGKEQIDTLPEEAAHFFVEMLGPGHPLYKEMFRKITDYKIYSSVVDKYKNLKSYRNMDGTINFDKLKKEAIGKLIAEHIIKLNHGDETNGRVAEALTWWQKLWKFITDVFNKSEVNPFEQSAQKILNIDIEGLELNPSEEEYYQYEDPMGSLRQDQNRITLDNSIDPRTGQKRHIYYYDGIQGKGSVTSVYVDKWLKSIFRSDERSETQKLIDLAKADYGDIIHEQMQDIIKSWTNPDGTKKATQTPIKPKINPSLYNLLNRHVESLMNQYERNTVFLSEVKIFDQKTKIAGSIDLLVVQPDGVVDIYDWKSQEIYRGQDDLKPYKEDMYRIQLENYRKILQLQYGFKNFGKVRAIPIKTQFIYKNNSIYGLKTLEIGDIDPNLIPEDKNYLLPVTLKNESTGNEQLDELIKKLNGIYDKIKNTKYSKEEVYKKREELGKLRLVLRDLQLRNRIDRLVDLGLLEYKKYSDLLESKTLTGKDLMEGIKILDVFGESGVMLYELREEYYETIKEKGDKKAIATYEEMNKKFLMMTSKVSKLIQDMKKYRDQQAKELGEKRGIMNLLDPEEPVGFFAGTFQALSNIKQKAFRVFSSILRKAQNDRDVRFQDSVDKLTSLKENFTKWASSKGLSTTAAMEMMLEVDDKGNWNGNFLDKYKPEFYQLRKKAIASGDALWVSKNMEYDEKAYREAEKKQIEFFKSVLYSYDKKENDETIAKKIAEWKTRHQVIDANGEVNMDAILNSKNRFLRPNDEWLSDKWNKLIDPSNKPLKDVYDYFQSTLRYAENLGMLDGYSPKFIPSMYATKIESLSFGDVKGFSNPMRLFDDLQVDAGNQYSPQIDPTDGTIINRVPVYFTNDIGVKREDGTMDYSKKSRDLFKVFAVWSKHMYNYEAMQSIEDASIMLVEAEKSKKSVVVDFIFGNPVIENGRIKTTDTNDPNAKLLSEFVNFYLYDQIGGRTKDTKFKIKGKEYSTLKSIQAAVSYFSLKTLGLNLISGSAQFVGGTGNALFQAQKGIMFTKKTWGRSMYLTASSKKAQAALRYLNILLEAAPDRFVDNLSLHLGDKVLNKNNAYFIQRQSDKAVQYPVAIAMMLEHMIDKETGNIVNIQDFVKKKYNYYTDFYNLPSDQREQIKAKIDKEVGELQEQESLLSVGVLDKDGNFSIPGIERTDEAYAAFRDKIKGVNKRILGNQSRDDINRIRTTLFGSALMQFRSWIPEMVEERTGQLKWDDELQTWSYGKFRVFFGDLFSKRMPRLLMSIITGFGDNAIELAKERYQVLQREAYERGEPFEISEGEFIDIYIANLRSMMSELLVVLAISGALFWALSGDDDDDKKGVKKYLARAIRKYYNEFMFYYSPIEFTRLLKNPVPAVGLAEDLYKITGQVLKEGYGRATGDEELTESAKPMKYLLRILPAGKEFLLTSAALDDDFRKEWDIRVDNVFY